MKLLFDATELSYYEENSGHRAGVFYVALNLYREFKKCGVDFDFVCDYRRLKFLKNIKEFRDIKILEENSLLNRFWGSLIYLSRKFPIRVRYAILILSRFYDAYFYKVNKKNQEQLAEYDAYFSPFTPPSKEIQESELAKFRMLHDVIPIMENGMSKSPKDWYYKIYSLINNKDYYFTNSENTKQDILKIFPFVNFKNIKTTYLAANEAFNKTDEKAQIDGKYIFSLCTLGKRKNLEFGIKNFFEFINRHNINDLTLVLGGSIWKKYEGKMDKILDKYDRSKIIMSGYIEENDLAKYYSNAVCFIYPSLYEGFGLPVLEAMQCGCPVITSNVSSLPEVIGDAGIQVNPTSDEEMIKAYEKMYYDKDYRNECIDKGLERAKMFSWEKCAGEILEYINENTPSK